MPTGDGIMMKEVYLSMEESVKLSKGSYSTVLKFPIKRNSLDIKDELLSIQAMDDGEGKIIGNSCEGSINYETGELNIEVTKELKDVRSYIRYRVIHRDDTEIEYTP